MFVIDADPRRPQQEGPVALIGLEDEHVALAVPRAAAALVQVATDQVGRIAARRPPARRATIDVVVVLPWVPAIAIARRPAANAAIACWRRHTGMPACAAATSSGLSARDRARVDHDVGAWRVEHVRRRMTDGDLDPAAPSSSSRRDSFRSDPGPRCRARANSRARFRIPAPPIPIRWTRPIPVDARAPAASGSTRAAGTSSASASVTYAPPRLDAERREPLGRVRPRPRAARLGHPRPSSAPSSTSVQDAAREACDDDTRRRAPSGRRPRRPAPARSPPGDSRWRAGTARGSTAARTR